MKKILLALAALVVAASPAEAAFILWGTAEITNGVTSFSKNFLGRVEVNYAGSHVATPTSESFSATAPTNVVWAHLYVFDQFVGNITFVSDQSSQANISNAGGLSTINLLSQSAETSLNLSFQLTAASSLTPPRLGDIPQGADLMLTPSPSYGTMSFIRSGQTYTGQISSLAVSTDAPEPTTWAMMLFGFGLIGASLRGRNMRTNRAAAANH
jgi:hypothetical protein